MLLVVANFDTGLANMTRGHATMHPTRIGHFGGLDEFLVLFGGAHFELQNEEKINEAVESREMVMKMKTKVKMKRAEGRGDSGGGRQVEGGLQKKEGSSSF